MSRVILLDTHPLSAITHPKAKPEVLKWLKSLREDGTALRVPEIADYELRRELIRQGKHKSINRLNQLNQTCLIPINSEVMQKAAQLWAWIRNQGQPTASKDSLDGDVILASQAILELNNFDEVIVMTTNIKHISRFASEGIYIQDWNQTLENFKE